MMRKQLEVMVEHMLRDAADAGLRANFPDIAERLALYATELRKELIRVRGPK